MDSGNSISNNPFLNKDSYKLSHPALYPKGIKGMSSYIEARKKGEHITFFGLQMFLMKYLMQPATSAHLAEAKAFATAHGEPFPEAAYQKILDKYAGFPPLRIYAVPEGLKVPSQNVLVRTECVDDDLFWMAMDVETALQRGVWAPSTIASNDYRNRQMLMRYLASTSNNLGHIDFMLHDFGARGVSSEETAQIAGAAHLVYFKGSDTISGIRAANHYYSCPMAAFSVPASEHSVQCSYGPMNQKDYLDAVLSEYAKPGAIVSIVIDGYDTLREALHLCSGELREKIIASKAKVVFRPDSGDPVELIPRILQIQENAFGSKKNSKGFKTINNVGIIQGDGVDFDAMESVLLAVTDAGYSADNIVFGSGGSLLQKVNRDTYGFAQKASAIYINGSWKPIYKAPVTDPGKVSKAGRLTLLRSRMTGEYMTASLDNKGGFAQEWEDVMPLVYDCGKLMKRYTLEEVRKNAGV